MEDIQPLKSWSMVRDTPIAIAGPCSAETEEQLFQTCKLIKENIDITMLRAGIWKPRTRPGSFEGIGEIGLEWFRNVKKELNMPITVEVATPQHVELALKYGVDVLWIGARSTVNPFTVQDIADVLKGVTDVPVMIKNPINPDLSLWLGGIERIYNAGVRHIAAIHRGFSSHEKTKYRNTPMWQLAIDMKNKLPHIPMICDPSHIGGTRDLILPIAQKAMDLDYDGLMIETHIDPTNAWSDASQQVTPVRLAEILREVKIRKEKTDDTEFNSILDELRGKIDRLDKEIIESLMNRNKLVKQIGEYKRDNNVTAFQPKRWKAIQQTRNAYGKELGLDESFITQLFGIIHSEAIRVQDDVMNIEPEQAK